MAGHSWHRSITTQIQRLDMMLMRSQCRRSRTISTSSWTRTSRSSSNPRSIASASATTTQGIYSSVHSHRPLWPRPVSWWTKTDPAQKSYTPKLDYSSFHPYSTSAPGTTTGTGPSTATSTTSESTTTNLNSNYEKPYTETDSESLGSSKSDDNLAGATSKTPNEKSKLTAKEKRKSKQLPPRPTLPDSEIHHVYLKGTGPGGQKINKTNSAAQLTHLPTGIVVKCQATRSRAQNHEIAKRLLAEKVELLQKGDESRAKKVEERKSKRKKSADKKKRRKYRRLEEEEQGGKQQEGEGQEQSDEEQQPQR
ncbi:hypothetical protein ABEF93_002629 [Exophiala dermatitidis]